MRLFELKFFLLINIAKFLEATKLVSKSASPTGTYDGEEFLLFQNIFQNWEGIKLHILDVGANNGLWAIKLSKVLDDIPRVTSHEILCIEPIPDFFAEFKINSSRKPNIRCLNIAISKSGSPITLAQVGNGATAYSEVQPAGGKNQSYIRVDSISGDKLLKLHGFYSDLIKVDTDGFDFEVIKTFQNFLENNNVLVQFEYSFRFAKKAGYSLREMINWLNELKYDVYVIDKDSKPRRVLIPRLECLNHQTKNFIALPESSNLLL